MRARGDIAATFAMALVVLLALAAAAARDAAHAISLFEDRHHPAPGMSRMPSSYPPNPALRLNPRSKRLPAGAPGGPDQGPRASEDPIEIPAAAAPWAVAIGKTENLAEDFLCAGVLVSPAWVLTTAHCVFLLYRRWPNDSRPFAFLGTATLGSPGPRFAIVEVVPHPDYTIQAMRNDLALLRIDTGTYRTTPIALQGPPIADQVGDIGTILGWGSTTDNGPPIGDARLKLLQLAIISDEVCFSETGFARLRNTGVFCGRSLLAHHDVCDHFSGSPLVLYDSDRRLYLAGLVTWNAACPNHSRIFSVFQDVQRLVPWILGVIERRATP